MSSSENLEFIKDVHKGLCDPSKDGVSFTTKGSYNYFHYLCDGVNDKGWGCGYRTLQSLCSWLCIQTKESHIPSIREIQDILVGLKDKPNSFLSSKEWIGSFEVCLVIDHLFNVPCKILHISKGKNLSDLTATLKDHFENFGCPIMMGGDQDCSSKGIMGIHISQDQTYLLVVDPHYAGRTKSRTLLYSEGWVKWQPLSDFLQESFYNLCLPQIKHTS